METWIWIVLILVLFAFFFWKPVATFDTAADQKQGIAPDIIQVIIEAIQKEHPDEVPLETLFINKVGNETYSARFMFLNTQGYFGTQYDVQAKVSSEGSVIITDMSTSAQVDKYDSGFTPYISDNYGAYSDITKNLGSRLQSELTNSRQNYEKDQKARDLMLSTESMASKYNQNIQSNAAMAKFMSTTSANSFTPGVSASSFEPGPSPARSGNMVASGASVFNSM
jgi:hypothetical protein